jgi:SAM-dependent methyltransferase
VHNATLADISRYYDTLHLWTRFNRGFRAFSGWQAGAIHRWLADPTSGEFTPTTIHQLMLSNGIGEVGQVEALDAGCGYGGSMFAFQSALGGQWRGLTISRRQLAVGRKMARQKGVADVVTFDLKSYDERQEHSYNLVYAIESLVHSARPARTIGNLAQALRPGGTFIIVDDMPAEQVPSKWTAVLEQFKVLWRCPVMPSARQWSAHLDDAGCDIVEIQDLSRLLRPRSAAEISQALNEVHARKRWRDMFGLRRIGEAEIGGLLLERLSGEQVVSYKLIRARKRQTRPLFLFGTLIVTSPSRGVIPDRAGRTPQALADLVKSEVRRSSNRAEAECPTSAKNACEAPSRLLPRSDKSGPAVRRGAPASGGSASLARPRKY